MRAKKLVTALAIASVAGYALTASVADAKERWKFGWAYPSTLAGHGQMQKEIVEAMNTLSGGEFVLKGYEPGALVPAMQLFDAVSEGSIDASYSPLGFWPGKEPAFSLLNSFPFGPGAVEYNAWFKWGNGGKFLDEIGKKHNIKILVCGTHSPEASGWFKEPITSIDQFKGMKMRIFGLGGKTLEKLGVNSQLLAAGDIYAALDRGVIDATEFSMPLMDYSFKFYEIAKHYYFPGWHQPYSTVHVLINRKKWDALDDRWKLQWDAVCDRATLRFLTMGEALNADTMPKFAQHGVTIHRWDDAMLAKFKGAWEELSAELQAKDPFFKKVWDDLAKFRVKYAYWQKLASP